MMIVQETADSMEDYKSVGADVLLLGGSKSPLFLKTSLDALEGELQSVRRKTLDGLDHLSAANDGKPEVSGRTATVLRLAEPIRVGCRSLRERSGHSAEPQLNSVSLAGFITQDQNQRLNT